MRKIRPILSWILVMAMLITNVDYVRATSAPNANADEVISEDTSVGDMTDEDVSEESEQGEDVSNRGVSENDISEGDASFIDVSGDEVPEENVSGSDGTNITISGIGGSESGIIWEITSDGVLIISGEQTKDSNPISPRWLNHKDDFTKVVITAKNVNSTSRWFYNCTNITNIDMSEFDTSDVIDMSRMFYNCSSLTSLNVSNFDTSNVTNMDLMFCDCSALTSLNVSNFNTSNVTSMEMMFCACSNLASLNLSNFDTSHVTDMKGMFSECSNLKILNLSNFDTTNVDSLKHFASHCTNLTTLDVSNFNTTNVTDMCYMFYKCTNLTTLDVSNFDTSNVIDATSMFSACSSITEIKTFPNLQLKINLPLQQMYDIKGNEYSIFPMELSEGIYLYANKNYYPPIIETSTNSYLTVYDEKMKTPISGVEVAIDNKCYKTDRNGSISFTGNKTTYPSVTFIKSGYTTKTVSLDMSNTGNKVYLTPEHNFNIQAPGVSTTVKLENSVDIAGIDIKWLDLKYDMEIGIPSGGRKGVEQELPFKIDHDEENNTLKVIFGIKQEDDDGDVNTVSYNKMKDICDSIGKKGASKKVQKFMKEHGKLQTNECGVKVETAIMGYFEYDLSSKEILECGAFIAMEGKGTLTWRPTIGGGIVYVKGTLTLSAEGTLILDFSNENIDFRAEIEFGQALKVGAGIGNSTFHGEIGVEGKLTEKVQIPFKSVDDSLEIKLSGLFYGEIKVGWFTFPKEIDLGEIYLIPWNKKTNSSLSSQSNKILDTSQMTMMSRGYDFWATTPLQDTYILENVYPDGEAQMCELEDGTLLAVWVADLGAKSDANRTTLVYSINKGNGWSAAEAICETGRGDFYPSIAVSGNKVAVTYMNLDSVLTEDVTVSEFLDNIDLYTTVYENGMFSTPQLLTESNNGIMELNAQIALDGDKMAVAWVENSKNDPFLVDGTNSIYLSTYENNTWTKELVAENLALVPSVNLSWQNNEVAIAYTLDVDNSLTTTEDIELYLWTDGEVTRLTSDSKADSNIQFLGNNLYWTSDSEIMQMTIGDITSTKSTGIAEVNDYQILQNATNRAILFIGADGFSNELYLSEEINGTFSTPVPVTDYGNHISDYAAVYRDNGEVTTLLFEREVLNTDDAIYGQTNLRMCETLAAHNLVLNEAWYNMEDITEDNKLPINLELYNASSEAVNSVKITLESGSKVLYTETIACDLAANSVAEISVNYPVAAEQMGESITVKAMPVNFSDSSLEDNTYELTLGLADVALKDFSISYQNGASVMTGTLTNEGYQAATNVVFTVLEGGADGTEIYTVKCGNLAAGAEYDITYTIPTENLVFSDAFDVKYFHIVSETDNAEDAYGNNTENLAAFPVKVTGLTIESDTLELTTNSTHKLAVTVAPENALDKTVHYISDKHEVAVVLEDGTIVACAEGTATISAITSDGAFVRSCVVTVTAPTEVPVTYEMNTRLAFLEVENMEQLSLLDGDGNAVSGITWISSDEAVATVDANGLVTAQAVGSAYITCTTSDNSYSNVCVIHVTSKELQALVFEVSSKELTEGDTYDQQPIYYPEDTTTDMALTWTSSDEAVAIVNSEGVVTAVAAGRATITATAVNGVSASYEIKVTALPRYTVTFDSGLGDEPVEITGVLGGSTITLPAAPVRENYAFGGWFTEENGQGEQFTAETIVEEDMYLYAYWTYKGQSPEDETPEGLWATEVAPQTYTGKAIKPVVQVYDGHTLLTEKTDYTISYKNNTKANDASNAKKAPTITVKGKGNYTGTETITFQILAKDLAEEDVTVKDLVAVAGNKVQKPVPTLTYNGKKLKNKTDFTVSYPDLENSEIKDAYKAPGTYTIRVEGKGNFRGTRDITFTITGGTLMSKVKIASIPKQAYTGSAIEPEVKVTYKGKTLVKDTDYTVTYKNNVEVGKATVIVTGMGDYAGTKEATFQITGISIAKAKVNGIVNKVYNGVEQTQELEVVLGEEKLAPSNYTVTYSKNINVGKATVVITGTGNYTGTVKKTFKITAYDIKADTDKLIGGIVENLTATYTKGGSTPALDLSFAGTELVAKKDYTLSYSNNKKLASAMDKKAPTIKIKGKGNFKGTITVPFNIVAKDLQDAENPLTINVPDVAYAAKAGKYVSKPILTDSNGKKLVAGTDYEKTVVYTLADGTELNKKKDAPEVGTVIKVTVKGKGNYTGTLETTYVITQASFKSVKIKINAQEYTGSAITLNPEDITVKVGKTELKYGEDYVIVEDSYKNNVKKGTASVTIKGIGNYGGEKTVKFKIASKQFVWFWNLF